MLSADLLYLTDAIKKQVLLGLDKRFDIDMGSAFFAATHTHSAPAVDPGKPLLGEADQEYIRFVTDRIAELLEKSLTNKGTRSRIYYGSTLALHSVNRRKIGWTLVKNVFPRRVMMTLPNFDGPNDETIRCIEFRDMQGRPVALIWNYACHPVAEPRIHDVSADFPGVVRRAIREAFQNEALPVLFLQGFGGNIRPLVLDKQRGLKPFIRTCINGPYFPAAHGAFTLEEYRQWSASLSSTVLKAFEDIDREPGPLDLDYGCAEIPLSDLIDGDSNDRRLRLQKLKFSSELGMVGISAEVASEYVEHLRKIFPWAHVIPVGVIDSAFGYLPTQAMVNEGGYEGGDYFPTFGLNGQFKDSVEEIIVRNLNRLAHHSP